MRIDVLTLFPEIFSGYLGQSVLKRAIVAGLVGVHVHNIRDWAQGSIGRSTIGRSAVGLAWCCGRSR